VGLKKLCEIISGNSARLIFSSHKLVLACFVEDGMHDACKHTMSVMNAYWLCITCSYLQERLKDMEEREELEKLDEEPDVPASDMS